MRKWAWVLLALAACWPAEQKFSRSAPFRAGSLKIHVGQDNPAVGLQSIMSPDGGGTIYINPVPELTEAQLSRIAVGRGRGDDSILFLSFNDEGSARFARVTSSNTGKRLVFVIDGHVVTAPVIQSEISGGEAVLEGDFTSEEAERLAKALSGS